MRILGAILISLAPALLGFKKYYNLILRKKTLTEIFNIFKATIDKIKYTNKELYSVLKGFNSNFFIFNSPITANLEYLKNMGLTPQEINLINGFLLSVQSGDREYIFSQTEHKLLEINALKEGSIKELKEKGKVILTVFNGIALMVFLVVI